MNKNSQPKPICCHTDIRFAFTLHEQWKVHSLKLEVKKKKVKSFHPEDALSSLSQSSSQQLSSVCFLKPPN